MSKAISVQSVQQRRVQANMERDVAQEREAKRQRQLQQEQEADDDSGYQPSHHSSSIEEDQEEPAIFGINAEERKQWSMEDVISAQEIEGLHCQAITGKDIEIMEDYTGVGLWNICKNPCCYRCKLIWKAEMDIMMDPTKGVTVNYIGHMKNTAEWRNMSLEQRIGAIGAFLAQNRQERSNLRRIGVIRLNREEAMQAIEKELYLGSHYMDSPRSSGDKDFRISVARVLYADEDMRAGFRFYMRGDIRDTAAYFKNMHFMEPIIGGSYTLENVVGEFREHSIEIAGSIVESILGLGMMYMDHHYEELSDMPEIVDFIESGLLKLDLGRRSEKLYSEEYYQTGKEQWKWDEYDEIWGFDSVPSSHPNYTRDMEGLRNRQAGEPDQLDERELEPFLARMGRREATRELRRALPLRE